MTDDELTLLTQPYSNLLTAYSGLRDNETISDKQLLNLQRSVIAAADEVVQHRLTRERYLSRWRRRDLKRADRWAHRDSVRQMKADRREIRRKAKLSEKAAKTENAGKDKKTGPILSKD